MKHIKSIILITIFSIQALLIIANQVAFEITSIDNKFIEIKAGKNDGVNTGYIGTIFSIEKIGGREEKLPIGQFKITEVYSDTSLAEVTRIIGNRTYIPESIVVVFDKVITPVKGSTTKSVSSKSKTGDSNTKKKSVKSESITVPEGKDYAYYYKYAKTFEEKKEYEKSLAYYDKLNDMMPNEEIITSKIDELKSLIEKEEEETQKEIQSKKIAESERKKLGFYEMLAKDKTKSGEDEEASGFIDKILNIDPANKYAIDWLRKRSKELVSEKKYAEAKKNLDKIFISIPDDPETNELLAKMPWTKIYKSENHCEAGKIFNFEDSFKYIGYCFNTPGKSHNKNYYIGTLDRTGRELYRTEINFGSDINIQGVIQDNLNGFYVYGALVAQTSNTLDFFMLKIDKNGKETDKIIFGSEYNTIINEAIKTKDQGFLFTGHIYESDIQESDLYVCKVSSNLEKQWEYIFEESKYDNGLIALELKDGKYIVVGNTNSFSESYMEILLIRLDQYGNYLDENHFGGALSANTNDDDPHLEMINLTPKKILSINSQVFLLQGEQVKTKFKSSGSTYDKNSFFIVLDDSMNSSKPILVGPSYNDNNKKVQDTITTGEYLYILSTLFNKNKTSAISLMKIDGKGLIWEKLILNNIMARGVLLNSIDDTGIFISGAYFRNPPGLIQALVIKSDMDGNIMQLDEELEE